MELTCKIPMPKELLSEGNKTDHWTLKAKRNKLRDRYLNAYTNIWFSQINLPCQVRFTRISPRKLDDDNWITTCKHFRDYIASKIIPGLAPGQADNEKYGIEWIYQQEKGEVKEYALKVDIWWHQSS